MSRAWMGYLAGAAFVLSAAGAAYAQTSVQTAQAQAAKDSAQVVRIERSEHADHADRAERVERRIIMREDGGHHRDPAEHMRTMLQLKPSQEGALKAYLSAVSPEHSLNSIVQMSDHKEAKTTTQRLAEMEQHLNEQAAQGRARIEATRKFYDQLEPSQKKVFDEMPMMMAGPLGPMMPMGGHMKVMINSDGHGPMMMHRMEGLPPLPPVPPAPPRRDD